MDLKAALDARNRADRGEARFQMFLALPFTLLGIGFANILILPLIYLLWTFGVSPGLWVCLAVFNVILAIFIVIDVKRRPEEEWMVPEYTLTDGSVKGHEYAKDPLLLVAMERSKGIYGGMPLMTNMSDPRNLARRGGAITNGFANLILGGPRSIGRALVVNRRIARRSRAVSSAERFTCWLGTRVVPETEVRAHLEAHRDQAEGLALARELEVVTRRRIQGEFHYHVQGGSLKPPA